MSSQVNIPGQVFCDGQLCAGLTVTPAGELANPRARDVIFGGNGLVGAALAQELYYKLRSEFRKFVGQ